jgi:hypothetical protein
LVHQNPRINIFFNISVIYRTGFSEVVDLPLARAQGLGAGQTADRQANKLSKGCVFSNHYLNAALTLMGRDNR